MIIKISEAELQARLSKIRLLALDVDGVLTDGGLYYTDNGEELKKFNVKDGLGIKLLLDSGLEVAIISASTSVSVLHRAKKIGIKHTFIGIENKLSILENLCEKLNITLEQVAYMGDDLTDIIVLQAVGCPITVADAMPANKSSSLYITKLPGGQGAVREICEYFLSIR